MESKLGFWPNWRKVRVWCLWMKLMMRLSLVEVVYMIGAKKFSFLRFYLTVRSGVSSRGQLTKLPLACSSRFANNSIFLSAPWPNYLTGLIVLFRDFLFSTVFIRVLRTTASHFTVRNLSLKWLRSRSQGGHPSLWLSARLTSYVLFFLFILN